MITKNLKRGALALGVLLSFISVCAVVHAATSITVNQTVANNAALNDQTAALATTTANATTGTNDQTFVSATTTANGSGTKASRTLTVNSLPTNGQTTIIGSCTVTYSSTTTDSGTCAGNSATFSITTHNTAASLAAALGSLTGVSDSGHGALTATSTGTTATFSTTGAEASATAVTFTDGTSGAVSSTGSVTGVLPVAEVLTVSVGGTAEAGDIFNITIPTGTISYTTVASDTNAINIATDIRAAIVASSTYASQPFTVVASTTAGAIALTAKTAGTGFSIFASATNRAVAAEVLRVTIGGSPEIGDIYRLGIPTGTISYTTIASDTSAANIAIDLNAALLATSTYSGLTFTSAVASNVISFTAKTPGTPFVLSTNTVNGTAVAQVVTFTFPTISSPTTYGITINGNSYSANDSSLTTLFPTLMSQLATDPSVSCTLSNPTITCTANVAGTAFTYGSSAADLTLNSGGGGGGSGGGNGAVTHVVATTPTVPSTTTVTTGVTTVTPPTKIGGASKITLSLRYLSRNNSVRELQTLFSADPNLHYVSGVTGYFGLKTQAAVQLFQTTYGVVPYSDSGYGLVGPKTRAALIRVYGL